MKKVITDYLDENVLKYPDKDVFIENKDKKITYLDFQIQSKKIASNIIKKNIESESIIIFIDKSINALKSMFGCLYSNNFYTVLDCTSPHERIDSIVNTLSPKLILTDNKNIKKIDSYNYGIDILNIDELEDLDYDTLNKKLNFNSSNPAYVLFTSGSTGIPKGSVISHNSLITYVKWFKECFNINNKTIFGSQTPFYFSMSVSDVYSTIMSGATLNIIPKINFSFPIKLIEYLDEYKINTIYWVPSALSIVANLKTFDYKKPKYLKKVLFAGEVMPMPSLNIWRKALPDVLYANLYGPTETTDICTYYIVNRKFKDNETLPIGFPCDNTTIILVNEGKKVSGADVGEIFVKGPFVGSGYFNNEEKTKKSFVQNPLHNKYIDIVYKTGDLGKYNEFGEIEYLGRKDFQIKHMGYRIELGEIESMINSIDGLTLCACVYDKLKSKIVLFFESSILDKEEVITYSNKHLLNYMRPNIVIKLPRIPYNQNGKIDRVKLKEIYEKGEY